MMAMEYAIELVRVSALISHLGLGESRIRGLFLEAHGLRLLSR